MFGGNEPPKPKKDSLIPDLPFDLPELPELPDIKTLASGVLDEVPFFEKGRGVITPVGDVPLWFIFGYLGP